MDRNKLVAKRPAKGKGHPPPGDFIALGSKARSGSEPDLKVAASNQPRKSLPAGSLGTKREPPSVPAGAPPKKPKLLSQTFTPLGRVVDERRASPTTHVYLYEEYAEDVEPGELFAAINDAEDTDDDEKVEKLLCGAIKYLKMNRAKPEPALFLTLMYLAKTRTSLFGSEVVIEGFCSLLKRDVSLNFKSKGNSLVSVLACNTMMAAFQDEESWPDNFIRVYMEDSLGERVWVDRKDCKAFVDNIQTAFNTKVPSAHLLTENIKGDQPPSASASPNPRAMEDDEEKSMDSTGTDSNERPASVLGTDEDFAVFPRYTYDRVGVESQVMDILREQLNRRQTMDGVSRNLLRVMSAACGYIEVRTMAGQRLEMWLQNPKLTRPAQDLLMYVCMNCDQHSQQDIEIMSQLCKIRLKTKPLVNQYLSAMRELLAQHPENLRTLMTHIIYNELSNSRNPNNMALLSTMFQFTPEQSARTLAEIFQDLLANRDDYLRALRALLREIVRSTRHDLNFTEFALGLMQERMDGKFRDMDAQLKDRLLIALTDLIALTVLVGVTPSVREAASLHARGDQKDVEVLRIFQHQAATIQRDAVWWLHTVVPKMFEVKATDYIFCMRKVLFVEKADAYHKTDNWPPEADRSQLLRLASEVPVLEDTLMRVLIIGLARELQVSPGDALDLADQLVRRAAMQQAEGYEVVQVERLQLIDAVFNLCAYRHPENIALPKGYSPPTLAISNLYWKAWIMLLIIAAFNPSTFGVSAWENYPMLRCFMEMVMTNTFKFPPLTMATEERTVEDIRNKDKQLHELEKQTILEFEGYLAAATSKVTITEANSLLISQLTSMDPAGIARRPPNPVLEQLKALNQSLHLGTMLCRSRKPYFLLDIIQRQGTSQSMPWLADLVESSEGSLEMLPVQCLCEFLLLDTAPGQGQDDEEETKAEKQKKRRKLHKQEQLLMRLQDLLHNPGSDSHSVSEVITYFLQRLSSQQTSSRQLAIKGLSLVLSKSHISDDIDPSLMDIDDSPCLAAIPTHRWLLQQLPDIPLFSAVKSQACSILKHAIQVETDAAAVSAYIVFLSQNMGEMQLQELDELALDMATLIVERSSLITHLFPQEGIVSSRADLVLCSMTDLFFRYLRTAQKPQKEAYVWSNTQDQILLQWESGESATMNILVVHAMIILLTFGQPKGKSHYTELCDQWFPEGGHPPTAFLVDTSEEALLLPDWLKLRMIRSSNTLLVEAALQDLEPSQLLLFVQSFGIPVASMSRLLACLDTAVAVDSAAMEQVVVDKGYMAQLIEVQHMRGASGGKHFQTMLRQGLDIQEPDKDIEMVSPIRRKRAMSQLCRAPELPLSKRDGEQLQQFLCQMLQVGSGPSLSAVERQQMFRTVMKYISKTDGFWERVAIAFHQLLTGRLVHQVFEGLAKFPNLSCPLLRVLLSKQKTCHGKTVVSYVLVELGQLLKDRSAAYPALNKLVEDHRRQMEGKTHLESVQQTVNLVDKLGLQSSLSTVVDCVQSGTEKRGESVVSSLMATSLKRKYAVQQVQLSASQLTALQQQGGMSRSMAGLLVDWLELLDPDLIKLCPEVEQQLLFARHTLQKAFETGTTKKASNQPYLLALLVHQSSWSSLKACVNHLLESQDLNRFNPTSVLDFLWACIHVPKIWQGRDRKLPKNHEAEDVMFLNARQIPAVIDYIIQEAASVQTSAEEKRTLTSQEAVDQRLPLLQLCCCNRKDLIKAVIVHLHIKMKDENLYNELAHHLLLQLYQRLPNILYLVEESSSLTKELVTSHIGISQLDAVTHRLLGTLGNARNGKNQDNYMYDANIACRKVAKEHPVLMLRQLPMITAILQGRASFTFPELRHRNHLTLYKYILGLLELVQPYIFQRQYTDFPATLAAIFELFKIHGLKQHSLFPLLNKFVHILHNFLSNDSNRAVKMLHQYVPLLSVFSEKYPEFVTLKSLLAGLSLPMDEDSSSRPISPTEPQGGSLLLAQPRPSSPWTVGQLLPFQQRISKGSSKEDVLEVLNDLDETSKRKVDVLEHFLGDLKRLMTDGNDMLRNSAHVLVMRHIHHNPSDANEFVPHFIQCLNSENVDVINSALKNLAEFSLLTQDHAPRLLQKVFLVGLNSKVETSSYLSEALRLLNMETLQ